MAGQGSSGRGVGGKVNLPPLQEGLGYTSTEGRRILEGLGGHSGVILAPIFRNNWFGGEKVVPSILNDSTAFWPHFGGSGHPER